MGVFTELVAQELEGKRRSMVRSAAACCDDESEWIQFCAEIGLIVTEEDRKWYRELFGSEG